MKKVLGTIATILGFTALSTLVLFFAMSPPENILAFLIRGPHTNGFTADIAQNLTGIPQETPSAASAPAPGGTSTAPATTGIPSLSRGTITPPAATETPSAAASIPEKPSVRSAASKTVSTPQPAQPIQPTQTILTPPAPPSLPLATATVTVTPQAPTPPGLLTANSPMVSPSGETLPLPYMETDFSNDVGWQTTWGTAAASGSKGLRLSAGSNSLGAGTYLKNSLGWTDYAVTAIIDWIGGSSFGVMAAYRNASNYVMCEYAPSRSGTSVQALQYINGYRIPLSPASTIGTGPNAGPMDAGISIQGLYVTCSLNGSSVSNEGIGAGKTAMNAPQSGGIGFSVYGDSAGAAGMIVNSVVATPQ